MIYKTNKLEQSYSKIRSPSWTFLLLCVSCMACINLSTDSKAKPFLLWPIWRKFLLLGACDCGTADGSSLSTACFGFQSLQFSSAFLLETARWCGWALGRSRRLLLCCFSICACYSWSCQQLCSVCVRLL